MKMRIFIRGEDDTPIFVKEVKIKGKAGDNNMMTNINRALDDHLLERSPKVLENGFNKIACCDDYWSTMEHKDFYSREMIREWYGERSITAEDEAGGDHYGVEVYNDGYVLIYGYGDSKKMNFFNKITKTKFKGSSRSDAKTFSSENALIKYLNEHRYTFNYMVTHYGYQFDYEKCSHFWKTKSSPAARDELIALLDEINNARETIGGE